MIVVVLFSIISILLTYLESTKKLKYGMFIGFFFTTLLGMIHYNYGSDYREYYLLYKEICSYTSEFVLKNLSSFHHDTGWILLNLFFKYLGGFFMLVAILNLIQNIIVFLFIKREVPTRWWPISVFIYLCNSNYYLLSFSMMRQELVILIFLGIWPWLRDGKYIRCLIVIFICTFIHSSSFVLLPFAFWYFTPVNNRRFWVALFSMIVTLLWFSRSFLTDFYHQLFVIDEIRSYSNTYSDSDEEVKFGLGFIINLIPLFVSISYLMGSNRKDSEIKMVLLAMISYIILPFVTIIPLIGRVSMYFGVYQIASIPYTYRAIREPSLRISLLSIYILITFYDYLMFFYSPIYARSYSTFHTILSHY